jgi:hypothetical protein
LSSIEEIIAIYQKDIDVSLIDENLKRTPEERVRRIESLGFFAEEIRAAKAAADAEEIHAAKAAADAEELRAAKAAADKAA